MLRIAAKIEKKKQRKSLFYVPGPYPGPNWLDNWLGNNKDVSIVWYKQLYMNSSTQIDDGWPMVLFF